MNHFQLSRRRFLQGAAAGSVAYGFGGLGARAQGASEINMIGWNSPKIMDIMARSETETGVKVNYDVLPAKWDDVMQKITLWGQTGYSGIDVLFADDLIGGLWGMNGWAEDLSSSPAWTNNSADIVDNINDLNNAAGGVWRIFFTMGLEPFFYNRNLIQQAPATWDGLVTAAKAATKPDAGVWGWRPLGGEGHAFNTVLLTLNQAGADLATLDDPATLTALEFMYDWVQTSRITPSSTVSEDNSVVQALAAAGKAAMWWTYDGGYNNILEIDQSVLTKDTLGVARWPKGPASDIGLVHGWGVLLPKASKKKDAAKTVIEWISQPSITKEICVAQASAPPYKSLLADAEMREKLPILTAGPGWEEMIRGAKFREPIVSSPQVTQLWSLFDNLGSYVLSGEKNPKDAQAWAVEEYSTIRS